MELIFEDSLKELGFTKPAEMPEQGDSLGVLKDLTGMMPIVFSGSAEDGANGNSLPKRQGRLFNHVEGRGLGPRGLSPGGDFPRRSGHSPLFS